MVVLGTLYSSGLYDFDDLIWWCLLCCLQLNGGKATTWLVISPINYISSAHLVKELNFTESRAGGNVFLGLGWVQSLSVKTCPQVLFGWDTFFNVVRTCYNISAIVACKAKPPARPCIWLVFWYIHIYLYSHTSIYMYILYLYYLQYSWYYLIHLPLVLTICCRYFVALWM